MADALTLSVTHSSIQGRARPLPVEHAPAPLTSGRALLPSSFARPSLCPTPTFFVSAYASKQESDSTLADALAYRTADQRS
jgi:hypothetical protein